MSPMKSTLIVVLLLFSELAQGAPSGHWLGMLKIKKMTYRIYLKYSGSSGQLFILNPKRHEIPLDTLFFRNDSLYFKRSDFYSIFEGMYMAGSNTIGGYWTDDGHKKHRVIFRPVDPDTLVGLRPKVLKTYQWKAPDDRGDDLKIGTLAETNTDMRALDSLSYGIMREEYPNMHAMLISRNGLLIYEEYFYGWKAQDLWLIQSATKSFTSALTGIALAKNEIKNIEDPICKYLDD
jgi:hypothetical protein